MTLDGKAIANELIERLKKRRKPDGFLGAVLVGENAASASFVREKERVARELGIDFRVYRLSDTLSSDELRKEVRLITKHKTCGGIIVQLPLPTAVDRRRVLNGIPPEKDVDMLGEAYEEFEKGTSRTVPPAVGSLEAILERCDLELGAAAAAVVGANGFLVGRPIVKWLEGKVQKLFAFDIGDDLRELKVADIVVLGTGKPGLVKAAMLKSDAIVIDFGYGKNDGKLCGDFDPEGAPESLRYTPTPGGTGPVLVAKLFENFCFLNDQT